MHQESSQIRIAAFGDARELCLSPLEFWRGTKPSQAANWPPLWKVFPFEMAATTVVAVTRPMPSISAIR
jgi:hypothetical protein